MAFVQGFCPKLLQVKVRASFPNYNNFEAYFHKIPKQTKKDRKDIKTH